jgi:hypothetical protein
MLTLNSILSDIIVVRTAFFFFFFFFFLRKSFLAVTEVCSEGNVIETSQKYTDQILWRSNQFLLLPEEAVSQTPGLLQEP